MKKHKKAGTDRINGDPTDMGDAALVRAAKAGQHSAFHQLWNRHSRKTLNSIYRITRNWHDAEDALQDTFLRAFVHLKSFDGRSAFSSWLHRIAINTALMLLRKRHRHLEFSIDGAGTIDSSPHWELADSRMDIGLHYEEWERQQYLMKAVCLLGTSCRCAIELRYLNDQSVEDVAMKMGTSVGAVKSRLFRARAALRKSLDSG